MSQRSYFSDDLFVRRILKNKIPFFETIGSVQKLLDQFLHIQKDQYLHSTQKLYLIDQLFSERPDCYQETFALESITEEDRVCVLLEKIKTVPNEIQNHTTQP